MMSKRKTYEGNGIEIHFDPTRCIHAEECVHGLPAVFDAQRRPWITPGDTSADAITRVVEDCPSGALTCTRTDGGSPESARECEPGIRVEKDGPLYVQGHMTVVDHEGSAVEVGPRAALCRCGQSKNKPFCDNTHTHVGFTG